MKKVHNGPELETSETEFVYECRPRKRFIWPAPAFPKPGDITIGKITAMPFRPQRDDWRSVSGERHITRPREAGR